MAIRPPVGPSRESCEMDERAKKVLVFTITGSVFAAAIAPSIECGPRDMCGVSPPENPHTHQDGPSQQGSNLGLRVVAVATTSATGTLGTPIYLKL